MDKLELFSNEIGGPILFLIILLAVWSMTWKGFALWKAAIVKNKWWFVALLIINTVGILEILYLFVFSKEKKEEVADTTKVVLNNVVINSEGREGEM